MRRLCQWALGLYPHAWRTRYGAELEALLETREVSFATLLDLVRGAGDAHLNPRGLIAPPRQRMRGALLGAACCWGATVVLGAGFAKATEDGPFRELGHHHALLSDVRLSVVILAVAGALVIALTGAPLVHAVLWQAWRERTPALVRAMTALGISVLAFTIATVAVVGVSHGVHVGRLLSHALFVAWYCSLVAVAVVCALAMRAGIMTTRFKPAPLVLGVVGAWLLARVMTALTIAVGTYAVLLIVEAPDLAASPNGPLRLSTATVLASQAVGMVLIATLATITTRRGMRALRGR
jgi:hypothetical protein